MAGQKVVVFKPDDHVVAKNEILACVAKTGKLSSRSGLDREELQQNMKIVMVENDQLHLRHPRLVKPFVVHQKFFQHAEA
jgi:hypothetical protein